MRKLIQNLHAVRVWFACGFCVVIVWLTSVHSSISNLQSSISNRQLERVSHADTQHALELDAADLHVLLLGQGLFLVAEDLSEFFNVGCRNTRDFFCVFQRVRSEAFFPSVKFNDFDLVNTALEQTWTAGGKPSILLGKKYSHAVRYEGIFRPCFRAKL